MKSDIQFAYVGRKACGCMVAATLDDPTWPKRMATDVADFIKDGLTIERVSIETVRDQLRSCKCGSEGGR